MHHYVLKFTFNSIYCIMKHIYPWEVRFIIYASAVKSRELFAVYSTSPLTAQRQSYPCNKEKNLKGTLWYFARPCLKNALALFGSVYVRCFRRMLYRQMHRIFSLRESNACRLSQPRSHDDLSAKRLPFPPSTTASSAQRWLVPSRTWKGVYDKQKECLHRRLFRQAMLKYLNYVRTYFPT